MILGIPRRGAALLGASFIVLLLATWLVPYRFPPANVVTGASFAMGYDNGIAYVCFVLALVACAIFAARCLPPLRSAGPLDVEQGHSRISRRLLALVALGHAVLFTALFLPKGRFTFSEGIYFQELLHRMTQGELPFSQFSYYYGPSMLYPAYWLIGIMGSLERAYAVAYVLTYLAGLVMLYVILAALLPSRRWAGLWFVFLSVGLFNPLEGLNFTFTRYLLPLFTMLIFARLLRLGGAGRFLAAGALVAFTVLYSLELGVLLAVGVAAMLAAALLPNVVAAFGRRAGALLPVASRPAPVAPPAIARPVGARGVAGGMAAFALGTVVAGVALIAIDPAGNALRGYPYSVLVRLTGEHNVPLYPHLPFVVLAAITVLAAAGWLFLVGREPRADRLSPWLLAYLPVAILAERASIALSDPPHIALFGLPAILLGLHVASRMPAAGRALGVTAAALFFGVMIPLQLVHLSQFVAFFRPAADTAAAAAPAPAAASASMEATLTAIVARGGTERPYYMYALDYYSVSLYHRLGLRYPAFETDLNTVTTPRTVQGLVDDLKSSNALVIIARSELDPPRAAAGVNRVSDALSTVIGFALPGSSLGEFIARSEAGIRAPLMETLRRDYKTVYELNGLVLLSR